MNTGKRIPATLTAILAILALTACGETPKGCGQGTVNNPDPGYVRWYELPDGSAAVRCFSDSGGASCDWGHIELIRRLRKATHRPEPANDPTICAICGAPLTDSTSSICPDCRELEKDW